MALQTILQQIRGNLIAIISLVIAITALSYTAWREEVTEKNRNNRQAGFEVLKNLGELQIIINYGHYQPDSSLGNPILGWGHIALISDLGQILPPPIPEKTKSLVNVWGEDWQKFKTDDAAADRITSQVDAARIAVVNMLKNLW